MADSTMKQIAEKLGVTKIRVYRYITKNCITETYKNGNTLYFDETTTSQIIQGLQDETSQQETLQNDSETNAKALYDTVYNALLEQLKAKDLQLAEKDKQISQLLETQMNLTATLNTAQALHAGTIQERLIVQEPPEPEEHKGFFKRFFFKER